MDNEVDGRALVDDQLSGTSNDLNEILTSLSIFLCKICHQFLIPPIRLVAGTGHVCGTCNLPKNAVAIHDSALEIVLQNLEIPCPNRSKGCKEKLDYFDVSHHTSTCINRDDQCPFRFVTDCIWEGPKYGVYQHCTWTHSDDVITANNATFELEVDISISNDMIKVFHLDREKFIVHVKCDLLKSKLFYFLYYIGGMDNGKQYSYSVEQMANFDVNNCSLQHICKNIILPDVNFTMDGNKDCALVVDLALVKQLAHGPVVGSIIRIISKSHNGKDLGERMLRFFECRLCYDFMLPPIFQCLSGHSICYRCRPKLVKCLTCRTGFGNTRNYALESLSNCIKFPCVYREYGCNAILAVTDISKHELECKVQPYNCPFMEANRCPWNGPYFDVIKHLKEQHSDKCKFNNYAKVCAGFLYESTFADMYCMIVNGDIFRVCYKRDKGHQNTYWAVQYVGPRSEAKKYTCEIGLLDARHENRKLVRFDLCQELTNFDSMFNQCIMLPFNVVSCFSNDGLIMYYCKIANIS